ncbi:MAG: methyltransferase domain-containing protein [Rhizobiales bacterium]|nr:methyltransferase domain-containing protein [Hyphomicrobiales bacterium]
MRLSQSFPRSLALSCLAIVILAGAALAEKFEPRVGQPGKDVVWVPSPQALVDRMLDMAKLAPGEYHMDLGSGDGRTVITAAKRGAIAVGVEYNPNMVALARENAKQAGVGDRATFIEGDLFKADISKANVITLFLLPDINLRLRPKLLDLRPGTRIVSNSFDMGDWTPDQTIQAGGECTSWCRAHLWIVPAKVGGTWKLPDGGELTLEQKYQTITGSLRMGSSNMNISNGKVIADQVTFTAGTMQYTGRVSGNTIEGIAQTSTSWRATR